ncbi:hypothetical protein KUH32_16500 [Thalassococcus sp. CAU 1522]|uniref:Uncharacterized protein n=1 Tax=Thalassococcus arenae TaxID=2851652 RepID=A0ABS6NCH1_9RHOB|nr:hypothetical protein [Thalassococcus arenae]MBV2361367.1 hypothetical protein [Thalassococcus arenae]
MAETKTQRKRTIHIENTQPDVVTRLIVSIVGVALTASAFGIWLVPGDIRYPEMSLLKLGLSLFMLLSGLCCLTVLRR